MSMKLLRNRIQYLKDVKGLSEEEATETARNDRLTVMQLSMYCTPLGYDEPHEGKGVTRCNRTACQTENHVAFTNTVMEAKYCISCAVDIRFCNDLNELDLYPNFNEELDELIAAQEIKNESNS